MEDQEQDHAHTPSHGDSWSAPGRKGLVCEYLLYRIHLARETNQQPRRVS